MENAIAGCAFRIAPERENELAQWQGLNNLTIALVDEPGFKIRVCLAEREVIIGVASLEYLWASVHAHLILYNEYCLAQRQGAGTFNTAGTDRSRKSLELLAWTRNNISTTGTNQWPAGLPMPERFPVEKSDVHVANELFLCAIAWIIHHEIAHIRLNHQSLLTARSIAEEKEADVVATTWILEKSNVLQESRKRTFGIAAAILALQGLHSADQHVTPKTHPAAYERIDYCLTTAGIAEDDEVFAFAAVTMQIQLACCGIDRKHDGDSFRDLYSEYLIEFARANAG